MKKTIIIEKGNLNGNGDKLMIEGIKLPSNPIPLLKDFDKKSFIGKVDIFKEDGVFKCDIDVDDDLLELYPAIGIQSFTKHKNEGGVNVIDECEVFCVSLNASTNVDPTILKIKDQ